MHALRFPVRIYYEDTDAGGIVYYANYLKFAERARTEGLRAAGLNQSHLIKVEGIAFVVRHCKIDFFKPAILDDCLTIESALHDISKANVQMRQIVKRDAQTLAELTVRLAVVDKKGKPVRMPEHVRKAIVTMFNP